MTKWHLVVRNDHAARTPFVADRASFDDLADQGAFVSGASIEGWDPAAWMQASRRDRVGALDDALQNHLGLPVFSASLSDALNRSGIRGIQYLPVKVLRPDGTVVACFSLANVTNVVEALDRQRSEYEVFPDEYFLPERRGRLRALKRVVLNAEHLGGGDVLRAKEYPQSLFVNDRFKRAFEGGRFSGLSFRPVEVSSGRPHTGA